MIRPRTPSRPRRPARALAPGVAATAIIGALLMTLSHVEPGALAIAPDRAAARQALCPVERCDPAGGGEHDAPAVPPAGPDAP
jgi:hypothetical protein